MLSVSFQTIFLFWRFNRPKNDRYSSHDFIVVPGGWLLDAVPVFTLEPIKEHFFQMTIACCFLQTTRRIIVVAPRVNNTLDVYGLCT